MSANWAYNLDMLAQNGVIDFDAPSYVMGNPARYVGAPNNSPQMTPNNAFPDMPKMSPQPAEDNFKPTNTDNYVKTPGWKKWALGAIAITALAVGGYKAKGIIKWVKGLGKPSAGTTTNGIKAFFSKQLTNIKDFGTNSYKTVCGWANKGWTNLKGLFKKP